MRATTENKDSIDKIHLMSGESKQTVRSFFEYLAVLLVLNHTEGESTNIPFLGTVSIENKGLKIKDSTKGIDIDIKIQPDLELLKMLQQSTEGDMSEIEKLFMTRIRDALRNYIQ